ncbi:MAG: myo-inositol-1-phosphate synthase, partial [Planctomycetes bacterium]|nr:myo-inositol-1-phosphate synthase [Planctomycetota bacterium]
MSPDPRKSGLFLVGARGAIASTVTHGLEGLRSGMNPLGMVTEMPEFDGIAFPSTASLRVRGWDVGG